MFPRARLALFSPLCLLLIITQAEAYWRMSCPGTLFTGRVDPIVNPNGISSHVHIVLGGNGFAPNMTYESTQKSTCTSCTIKGDMSNYWTPSLYYRAQNGSFVSVSLVGGQGGTVYYQQRATYKGNSSITAFPKGFRMLAGNPDNRVVNGTNTTQQAVSFACLDYSGNTHVPEGELLPNVTCPDGVRAQIYFPQCWDGVNLDSVDHQSHMAYPSGYNGGECPDSHPVPTMGLFYEFLYDTGHFPFWTPSDASQPFVFSMGDPTGRGFHGDFISGWDVDVLQNGINKKTTMDAGAASDVTYDGIFEFPDVYGTDCSLPPLVDEQVEGVLSALPGCNPVSVDAVDDHSSTGCAATTRLAVQTQQVFTDVTSAGWKYLGCGNDTSGEPSLPEKIADSANMTVESCVEQCGARGYSYAGLEYSTQCFCGTSLPASAVPLADSLGDCHMKCSGNASQTCGDANRLSLYQSCKGAADASGCQNAFVGFVGQVGELANNTETAASTVQSLGASASATTVTVVPVAVSTGSSTGTLAVPTSNSEPDPNLNPSLATTLTTVTTPAVATTPPTNTTPSTPLPTNNTTQPPLQLPSGWSTLGCFTDSLSQRALQGITFAWWGEQMTTSGCATYCSSQGYTMAGTEFGMQCFCGDQLVGNASRVEEGECDMGCEGGGGEVCGGELRLTLVSSGKGSDSAKRRRRRNGRSE